MLTLGIPAHPVMALMIGAFIIQGITPGPNVITDEPALFWGIIVSMWVGNLLLVLLNLPLIGLWVKLLTVPYRVLFPAIVVFASLGCYAINSNVFDVYAIAVFGVVGYVLVKLGCEPAPLLLGFVLGPLLEEHLRRAMILSRGDPMIFVEPPDLGRRCSALAAARDRRRRAALGPEEARRGLRRGGLTGRAPCCTAATPAALARALRLGDRRLRRARRRARRDAGRWPRSTCRWSSACRAASASRFDRAPRPADRIASFVSGLHPGLRRRRLRTATPPASSSTSPRSALAWCSACRWTRSPAACVPLDDLPPLGLAERLADLRGLAGPPRRRRGLGRPPHRRRPRRRRPGGARHRRRLPALLARSHGAPRVAALAERLGWSRKRLAARFREEFGLSPKPLARVMRFRRAQRAGRLRPARLGRHRRRLRLRRPGRTSSASSAPSPAARPPPGRPPGRKQIFKTGGRARVLTGGGQPSTRTSAHMPDAPCIFPALRCRDAAAMIDWLAAFGFAVRARYGEGDRVDHAELALGGSILMLGSARDDAFGRWSATRPPVAAPSTSPSPTPTACRPRPRRRRRHRRAADRPRLRQPRVHRPRPRRPHLDLRHLLAPDRRLTAGRAKE